MRGRVVRVALHVTAVILSIVHVTEVTCEAGLVLTAKAIVDATDRGWHDLFARERVYRGSVIEAKADAVACGAISSSVPICGRCGHVFPHLVVFKTTLEAVLREAALVVTTNLLAVVGVHIDDLGCTRLGIDCESARGVGAEACSVRLDGAFANLLREVACLRA